MLPLCSQETVPSPHAGIIPTLILRPLTPTPRDLQAAAPPPHTWRHDLRASPDLSISWGLRMSPRPGRRGARHPGKCTSQHTSPGLTLNCQPGCCGAQVGPPRMPPVTCPEGAKGVLLQVAPIQGFMPPPCLRRKMIDRSKKLNPPRGSNKRPASTEGAIASPAPSPHPPEAHQPLPGPPTLHHEHVLPGGLVGVDYEHWGTWGHTGGTWLPCLPLGATQTRAILTVPISSPAGRLLPGRGGEAR